MNEKIFDKLFGWLGAIGTIDILLNTFFTLSSSSISDDNKPIVVAITNFVFIIIILSFFYFYKKKFVNLYTILNTIAHNNKLHTIREMVMIQYKEICNDQNHYQIKKAEFKYTLIPAKNDDCEPNNKKLYYDVDYNLSFQLQTPFIRKLSFKERLFKFFAIIETGNIEIKEASFKEDGNVEQFFMPIFHQSTISGKSLDKNKDFAGLYEVTLQLPPNIKRKESLMCNVNYTVRKNINSNLDVYSFVIIPNNYGKTIQGLGISLIDKSKSIQQLELIQADTSGEIKIVSTFKMKENENQKEYQLTYENFKPDMKTIYFIQAYYNNL